MEPGAYIFKDGATDGAAAFTLSTLLVGDTRQEKPSMTF